MLPPGLPRPEQQLAATITQKQFPNLFEGLRSGLSRRSQRGVPKLAIEDVESSSTKRGMPRNWFLFFHSNQYIGGHPGEEENVQTEFGQGGKFRVAS